MSVTSERPELVINMRWSSGRLFSHSVFRAAYWDSGVFIKKVSDVMFQSNSFYTEMCSLSKSLQGWEQIITLLEPNNHCFDHYTHKPIK